MKKVTNNPYRQQCLEEITENFITALNNFGFVTFHLPDDKNLMKLKVSDRYISLLEEAIHFNVKKLQK